MPKIIPPFQKRKRPMQSRCHFGLGWLEVFNLTEICTEYFCLRPVPQSKNLQWLAVQMKKQKGEEQKAQLSPMEFGVKNKAIPSMASTTEAAVNRHEPTEKRNFIIAVNRISDRTKRIINTSQISNTLIYNL